MTLNTFAFLALSWTKLWPFLLFFKASNLKNFSGINCTHADNFCSGELLQTIETLNNL